MSVTRILIVITALALVGLISYGVVGKSPATPESEASAPAVASVVVQSHVVAMPPVHEIYNDDRRQRAEAERQIEQMRELQSRRAVLAEATRETRGNWEELRMRNEWKMVQLVRTNMATFLAMKKAAGLRTRREVTCEICGGDQWLDLCVVCDRTGKCPTCKGTGGQLFDPDKPCPTCEGRKKCFLCAGRKKMKCNFCEAGKVSTVAQPPRTLFALP